MSVGRGEVGAPIVGKARPLLTGRADTNGRSRLQCHGAGLANHLGADVVAVLRVDEDFDVDEDARSRLEDDELRIHEGRRTSRGASEDGGGGELIIQQPACDVDLMDGRVLMSIPESKEGGTIALRCTQCMRERRPGRSRGWPSSPGNRDRSAA